MGPPARDGSGSAGASHYNPRMPPPAHDVAPLLRARGLGRSFGRVSALGGVDLDLSAGESVALLGPNGAGKTTLLRVLAGSARRDAGTLDWADGPGRVGWVPQRPALYPRLSARENLRLFAGLERADDPAGRADALIARAALDEYADRPAGTLSTGTLARLNLAIALTGAPSVLLLDEPTATISPEHRGRLWDWLRDLRAEGLALLFSTQSVHEAHRHADRVLVLAGGRPAFAGTLDDMVARHGRAGDPHDEPAEAAFLRLVGEEG